MTRQAFWILESPSNEQKLAEWDPAVEQESIDCPQHPGHQRPGKRLGPLVVSLPSDSRDDLIWSWYGECMAQDHVLTLLRREGITGYVAREAEVRQSAIGGGSPHLSELVVTGWGGFAQTSSGIALDGRRSCSDCGLLVYSGLTNPKELFDPHQWDGSDFFMIWPLPRFFFISDRLAQLLRAEEITGARLTPIEHLAQTSATLSPGRLSYWMPSSRAQELGESLGIA